MRRDPDRASSLVSRKLVLLLLAVTIPPAVTLVWLGFELFAQDRALLATVADERREADARSLAGALDAAVVGAERLLPDGPLPDGMVRLTVTPAGLEASPADRLLWLPIAEPDLVSWLPELAQAEQLEYVGAPDEALSLYETATRTTSGATRGEALLGVARIHRQAQRWTDALAAYERLASLDKVPIAGAPASLQARRARLHVLDASGRRESLAREAATLRHDFEQGAWSLDRAAWELTARDIERWTGTPVKPDEDRIRLTEAVSAVGMLPGPVPGESPARATVESGGEVFTVIRLADERQSAALVVAPAVVAGWLMSARARTGVDGFVAVVDADGRHVAGDSAGAGGENAGDRLELPSTSTGLPWRLVVAAPATSAELAAFESRRRQLTLGLVAILLLVTGGGYFLWRVMRRELAVGQLQTAFVAAVSHEFRTPLTSLQHITDLLGERDDLPAARRSAMYDALGRNVVRLRRLVESLLDFSRMESGRRPYDLQPIDAVDLVRAIVADFRRDGAPSGFTIDLDVESPGPLMLRGDAASLTNALWNLLDNAVKYSPDKRTAHVSVSRHEQGLAIAVRDEGLGIPARERADVFRRFVRGAEARQRGIAGTGLGLAMVAHIARAHHGTVEVESAEGAGSTFRLVLPTMG